MPTEISNADEFVTLSTNALECRVKRVKDVVKLKLRTPKQLYTIKLDEATAEEILKKVHCEVREV